jgi:uncharacterized protein (TIGR02145 family)
MKDLYRFSGIISLLMLIQSCIKPATGLPDVITSDVSKISYKSATSGGIVTNERGSAVTSRGVRWYTSDEPDFSNISVDDSIGTGNFTCDLYSLIPNTNYIIRAFATNSAGTGYGSPITFTTSAIEIPVLTTNEVTKITQNSAESGGNITDSKGENPTSSGVCWSTVQNPTIQDSKTSGILFGNYKCFIKELTAGTYYYVRAYSTNSAGTGYGNQLSFKTLGVDGIGFNPNLTYGTITDIEGNVYKIITIGTQVWMAENLKTRSFSNGDLIGSTTPATLNFSGENSPEYQWAYSGDESNVALYGRLYTWDVITDSRNLCPTGWHVPSNAEWITIYSYVLGGTIGGKLKETGTSHWKSPNSGATNESGFTALPGGYHSSFGNFDNLGTMGTWWSTTEVDHNDAIVFSLSYGDNYPDLGGHGKGGYSVRCVRDY